MKTSNQLPDLANQTHRRETPLIGVRISIAVTSAVRGVFPDNNRICTEVLRKLLFCHLETNGYRPIASTSAFPLNRSFYLFDLASPNQAQALSTVEAVLSEILEVGMSECAQIAWYDHREGCWRLHYPSQGQFQYPTKEAFEAEEKAIAIDSQKLRDSLKERGDANGSN